jgi:hypothetical protein
MYVVDLDPLGWDGMDVIPDMSNLEEELIADRMRVNKTPCNFLNLLI